MHLVLPNLIDFQQLSPSDSVLLSVEWMELGLNAENNYSAYNCSQLEATLFLDLIKAILKSKH